MALTDKQILANPALHDQIRLQSGGLLSMFDSETRLSAVFATQQRWLMSHIGLSLYFRNSLGSASSGLFISPFLEEVRKYKVASRNTADAYIKELVNYRYLLPLPSQDRRLRLYAPAPIVLMAFAGWLQVHLASLDALFGGARLSFLDSRPDAISRLQPLIAQGLLTARTVRNPEKTFSLFTWLDNGGLVMDWLISSMEAAAPDAEWISAGPISVADMAGRLNLSRTHLARKLKEAEGMNSIRWNVKPGPSALYVSKDFRAEYAAAQAIKLSIIDQACEAVFSTGS